jgi:hypothetical protein
MGRRIASQSKQTVRGGPKPAKVGLHRRLVFLWLDIQKYDGPVCVGGEGHTHIFRSLRSRCVIHILSIFIF